MAQQITDGTIDFSESSAQTVYVDIARALSAKNAKYVTQTVRRKGKYIPQNFIVRASLHAGDAVGIEYLPNVWPVRNSVVLAGAVRDQMLKRSGMKRASLNTYDKELQIKLETGMTTDNTILSGASDPGTTDSTHSGTDNEVFGLGAHWSYTKLVHTDDEGDAQTAVEMVALGNEGVGSGNGYLSLINNWRKYRREFDPSDDSAYDKEDNLFSRIMDATGTADDVIAITDDEGGDKPYDLSDFQNALNTDVLYSGSNGTVDMVVPLGLLKITLAGAAFVKLQVLGVADM